MSRSRSYIPKTDVGKMYWFNNFVLFVGPEPEAWGLSQAQFDALAALAAAYQEALRHAVMPTTRTTITVGRKNTARGKALAAFRTAAMIIKNNPAIDDHQKMLLSIHVDKPTKSPIPRPRTAPALYLLGAMHGGHVLRYTDNLTPSTRAKPFGVAHLELHVAIAERPIGDPAEARLVGNFTRQPILVELPSNMAGRVATYFGRWVTRTGKTGPWSPGVSLVIAYGNRAESTSVETSTTAHGAVNGRGTFRGREEIRGRTIRKAA